MKPTISCPIGTVVDYRSHPNAEPRRTKTRSEAWLLGGHTRVVMVEGIAGGVALDALTLVRKAEPPKSPRRAPRKKR